MDTAKHEGITLVYPRTGTDRGGIVDIVEIRPDLGINSDSRVIGACRVTLTSPSPKERVEVTRIDVFASLNSEERVQVTSRGELASAPAKE